MEESANNENASKREESDQESVVGSSFIILGLWRTAY